MSQQIFDKHWPLAKNGANELIPGAAILQTRDDKDEPITLAAAVQWDESSGLFLPTHKENPLEVRVRELEAKLDELKQTIESGVQLKGSIDVLGEITTSTIIPAGGTLELIPRARREGYREVRAAVYLRAGDSRGNYRLRVRLLQPHSNQNSPVGFAYLKTFENEYYGHGRTEDINSPRWCVEIVNDNDFDATLISAVILGVK